MPQVKPREYPSDIPQFSKLRVAKKYLKNNKHNSTHLARNYARISVFGHHLLIPQRLLFSSSYTFLKLFASRNSSSLYQVSEHIFAPNGIEAFVIYLYEAVGNIKITVNVNK